MLESLCHGDNTFVTLTYSDDKLPMVRDLATLEPKHLQDFLKRLRKAVEPKRLRFFAVGEYGDESFRPHYHLALFGYPNCQFGLSRYDRFHMDCCTPCDLLRDVWGLGHIKLGALNTSSAQYVAGYVTKKMGHTRDARLNGRWPEFARMSIRPGLGVGALPEIADQILALNLVERIGDVPSAMRHGKRLMPLGRYLRRKLREQVGMAPEAPAITLAQAEAAVSHLRDAAYGNPSLPPEVKKRHFQALIQNEGAGSVASAVSRSRVFKQKRVL